MNDLGYSKRAIDKIVVKDTDENDVEGTVYLVNFYLPGGVTDLEQKFFVANTEDVDTVLSNAYYEKHLSLINKTESVNSELQEVIKPKAFAKFDKSDVLKSINQETASLLKDSLMPDVPELNGGLYNP